MIWFDEGRFWDGIGCKAILFKAYLKDRNGKHVATEISGIFITDLFIV